jgi:hypothetical protein
MRSAARQVGSKSRSTARIAVSRGTLDPKIENCAPESNVFYGIKPVAFRTVGCKDQDLVGALAIYEGGIAQIRADVSELPEIRARPSGVKASAFTASRCPVKMWACFPEGKCQR